MISFFGFPHQEAVIDCSMLVEQCFSLLLELLWADLFGTNALWNNHGTAGNFSKSLCKYLSVHNVAFNDFCVVIISERPGTFVQGQPLQMFE